ncbi:MAG: hypothetical protein COB67_04710 [SAR324 cluster bacterium]|uniref:ABC transporter domain-containing protein n=1 Tax=SAR324 cluster bacterium TaxID=2024889 RepID=A0A2A4T684_9DELT|nr:MAG: hypothetical protein COB67_04710 [SAR324 cluster bacterium]
MVFGGLVALQNVNFTLPKGIIKTIIGPNGAGKSTFLNAITGLIPPTEGEIHFLDQQIAGKKSHEIAWLGISRTFQHVETFTGMSVLENVMVGSYPQSKASFFSSGFKLPWVRREEKEIENKAMELLKFVGLADQAEEDAEQLPLGEQKILEIARALAGEPVVLCLDEPAAGLNETDTLRVADIIRQIKKRGISVILIEHDLPLVMSISDEIMVLNYGEKLADGAPEQIRNNQAVIDAYLGGDLQDVAS